MFSLKCSDIKIFRSFLKQIPTLPRRFPSINGQNLESIKVVFKDNIVPGKKLRNQVNRARKSGRLFADLYHSFYFSQFIPHLYAHIFSGSHWSAPNFLFSHAAALSAIPKRQSPGTRYSSLPVKSGCVSFRSLLSVCCLQCPLVSSILQYRIPAVVSSYYTYCSHY